MNLMKKLKSCNYLHILISLCVFTAYRCSGETKLKLATVPDVHLIYATENLFMQIVEPEDIAYLYKVKPAKNFGGDFDRVHHNIKLIPGEPYNGCSAFTNKNQLRGAVALVKRGDCSFVSKTINAEDAGALAVLIADSDEENNESQIQMIQDGTARDAEIPSLFLLGKDGFMIKKTLEKYSMDSAVINIPVNVTGMPQMFNNQPPWTFW